MMTEEETEYESLVSIVSDIADNLRCLADRLERRGPAFADPDVNCNTHAADIVSDYVQGCGQQSALSWALVVTAGRLEALRASKAE